MRKFALAAVALFATVGLTLAAEAVFLGFDKDKGVTVKEGDKEVTYKVTDKTTFKSGDKDVPNDKGIERLTKMDASDKAKGKAKIDITGEKGTATEIKFFGKKKN